MRLARAYPLCNVNNKQKEARQTPPAGLTAYTRRAYKSPSSNVNNIFESKSFSNFRSVTSAGRTRRTRGAGGSALLVCMTDCKSEVQQSHAKRSSS